MRERTRVEIKSERILLRDPDASDVDARIRWITTELEWGYWDAPWEGNEPLAPGKIDSVRQRMLERMGSEILPNPRNMLYIQLIAGPLLGWVSAYDYDSGERAIWIGIDICESTYWGKGLGTEALRLWIGYLFRNMDIDSIRMSTWSGNERMIKCAEKLGFKLYERISEVRIVQDKKYDAVKFIVTQRDWQKLHEQRCLDTFNRNLEEHWGFPDGTLSSSSITHIRSDANMAAWTVSGGAVACSDEDLAARIISTIERCHAGECKDLLTTLQETLASQSNGITCSLDIGLYCSIVPDYTQVPMVERVERLAYKDIYPEDEDDGFFEHIFGIRDGSTVIARAMSRLSLKVDDCWLYAIGVGTHPDHQGKGLGKAVTATIVNHVVSEGGMALWNCDASNIASLRLAHSIGFKNHLWTLSWQSEDMEKKIED